jgi:hypothetical protein
MQNYCIFLICQNFILVYFVCYFSVYSEFEFKIRIFSMIYEVLQNNIWLIILNLLINSYLKITEKFKDSLKSTIIGCICSLF